MILIDWPSQMATARTQQQLLNIAREYLATLSPAEYASVPVACRPTTLKGIDDLYYWQQRLAEEYLDRASHDPVSGTHRQLVSFFTAACDRASEMSGSVVPPEAEAVNDSIDEAAQRILARHETIQRNNGE